MSVVTSLNYLSPQLLWAVIIVTSTLIHVSTACSDTSRSKQARNRPLNIQFQEMTSCPKTGNESENDKKYICDGDSNELFPITTTVDYETGELDVTYNLEGRQYHSIDIYLYSCEDLTETKCKNISSYKDTRLSNRSSSFCNIHSIKYLSLLWSNSSESSSSEVCSKNVTTTFNYVYSSCYYIVVEYCYTHTKYIKFESDVFTCPEMVKTNYKKEFLTDKPFLYADTCISDNGKQKLGTLALTIFENLTDIPEAMFTLSIFEDLTDITEATLSSIKPLLSCQLQENSIINCRYNDSEITLNCLQPTKIDTQLTQKICTFHNVSEGIYLYSYTYNDVRCQDLSVWTEPRYVSGYGTSCSWEIIINCNFSKPKETLIDVAVEPSSVIPFLLILVSCLFMLLLFITLAITFIFYSRGIYDRFLVSDSSEPMIPLLDVKKTKLALVYTRDSELFLNAMIKFSNLLKTYGFEVFDYLDVNQANDVSRSPEQWLYDKIMKSDFTIVVASECAIELEKRHLNHDIRMHYQEPSNLDNLFVFALCVLKQNISHESQLHRQKLFVVSIADSLEFGEPFRLNSLISPSHHCLPSQLNTLLTDLLCVKRNKEIHGLNKSNEFYEFSVAVKKYNDHMKQNPYYITEILNFL